MDMVESRYFENIVKAAHGSFYTNICMIEAINCFRWKLDIIILQQYRNNPVHMKSITSNTCFELHIIVAAWLKNYVIETARDWSQTWLKIHMIETAHDLSCTWLKLHAIETAHDLSCTLLKLHSIETTHDWNCMI